MEETVVASKQIGSLELLGASSADMPGVECPASPPRTRSSSTSAATERQPIIIQATPFCNIDCRYCYLPDRSNRVQMKIDVFEDIVSNLFSSSLVRNEVTICWHCGEPMTVPLDRYADFWSVIEKSNTHGRRIEQNFQTNGTLINDKWCEFFKKTQSTIGLSVDGPEILHNRNRVDRRGRGTFHLVKRGIDLLRKWQIPFGVICVLDHAHLGQADAIYDFLLEIGATGVNFNMQEIEGTNRFSSWSNHETTIQ